MLLAKGVFSVFVILCTLWASAALWIDGAPSPLVRSTVVLGFLLVSFYLLGVFRPRRFGVLLYLGLFSLVGLWWFFLPPSNSRVWLADVERPPHATLEGDLLTIENVRNFAYRSENEFDANWETRTYDLSELVGVDFVLSYWGSPWIAHTIMIWDFAEGPPLAISIETRKEEGEEYSAVLGFFRQFELYYVVADERDLLGVRTHHRGEEVYLYRLDIQPAVARALLLDYVAGFNELAKMPAWYNALTQNCTTTIRVHLNHVGDGRFWDWRILANGKIDQLGYERGRFDTGLEFDEFRRRSRVDTKVAGLPIDDSYSLRIREGLPGFQNPSD